MNRLFRWYDYLTFNIYWLGLSALSNTMTPLVVPLLVQSFVGEQLKGTYYGNLRLWTLMVAILVQALMGMLSDRSTLRWGRRRPFIVAGTLGDLVMIALVGFSAGLEGLSGYWFLFGTMILLMVTTNTAHGATQGIIPDLVPLEKRGRFSAFKALLEIPIPLILVSFTIARLVGRHNLWGALLILMVILIFCMLVTLLVPEQPNQARPQPVDWKELLRLALMTGAFTLVILGIGWLVRSIQPLLGGLNYGMLLATTGLMSLIGMVIAVYGGVTVSLRIGVESKTLRKDPSFRWWVINRLAFLIGANNLASFAIYFMQARLGYVQAEAAGPASRLTMLVGVFILASALPSGWLSDRFGRRRIVAWAGLLAAGGTLLALAAPSLVAIYIGGCIIGMGMGLFYTANWALGTEIVPKEEAGRFLGISNLAGAGAGAIGAYIGGPMADFLATQMPKTPEMGYVLLFAIYGVLFLVSIGALTQVRETSKAGDLA
ncbi:Na+/melibiose symporter [Longilinea arvoryzae]|uniref:Na+/melibiose symporter n=1 Tax=Longilinea arvoryzae TaxID=360412 RepID=A0A0S7BL09_9CHLR|nr:MFS transporter [Longilinea arvoryzae]GAP14683.1 Na+/melibiose symporter [Longilinea arvoryzae]